MSWTDKELDELFKEAAAGKSFEYNAAYFKDIEAQLPVKKTRRKGLIWLWGSMGTFLVALTVFFLVGNPASDHSNSVAQTTVINESLTGQSADTFSKANTTGQSELRSNDQNVSTSSVSSPDSKNGTLSFEEEPLEKKVQHFEPEASFEKEVKDLAINSDITNQTIGSLSFNRLQSSDLIAPEIQSTQNSLGSFNQKSAKLFLEFAGGIGQSPINSTELGSAKTINWNFSAGYNFTKNRFGLSAGAGVSQTHFNNLYIKERSTIYGFGVNTFDNHYQFTSVFKLDLPLNVSYKFGSHELSAGWNTSIPLFTEVSYIELKDGIENESGKSFSATSPYFRKIFLEPNIGYRFSLDRNWSIGANIKAQLINPIGSERVKGSRSNLPLSGQITLRRTIDLK